MADVIYTEKPTAPDSVAIATDVAASAMTDKGINGVTWHEDEKEIFVHFTGTLSAGDVTILDGIVASNS